MSETEEHPKKPDTPKAHEGVPRQALSGGGTEVRAGSDEGGSAYGDDREDEEEAAAAPKAPRAASRTRPPSRPPRRPRKRPSPPRMARRAPTPPRPVNNTGEPRPVKRGEGVEGQPGDDVDAASG